MKGLFHSSSWGWKEQGPFEYSHISTKCFFLSSWRLIDLFCPREILKQLPMSNSHCFYPRFQIQGMCQNSNWPLPLTPLFCTTLHCIILKCTALQCIAFFWNVLHWTSLNFIALGCTALHYTALPCIGLQYPLLNFTALYCTLLHYIPLPCISLHYTCCKYLSYQSQCWFFSTK